VLDSTGLSFLVLFCFIPILYRISPIIPSPDSTSSVSPVPFVKSIRKCHRLLLDLKAPLPSRFPLMLTNFLLTPHSTRRLPVFRHLFSRSSTNIMSTPPSTGPLLGQQGCIAWKTTPPLFGCPLLLSHLPISSPMPYGTLV